jgi:hypothetical protein
MIAGATVGLLYQSSAIEGSCGAVYKPSGETPQKRSISLWGCSEVAGRNPGTGRLVEAARATRFGPGYRACAATRGRLRWGEWTPNGPQPGPGSARVMRLYRLLVLDAGG